MSRPPVNPGSSIPLPTEGSVLRTESCFTHPEYFPYESHPDGHRPETHYFPAHRTMDRPKDKSKTLVVCVPMYNEEKFGLYNTIHSLSNQILDGEEAGQLLMEVIILMDGAEKIPSCTRQLLTHWFGVDWRSWQKPAPQAQQTTIYETSRTDLATYFHHGKKSHKGRDRARMRLSLLIKTENLKKHNSHEWFMKAFAHELDATYVFCTDCATTFHPEMLQRLVENLHGNPTITAVCGRQRVMPAEVQTRGQGSWDNSEGSSDNPKYQGYWDELLRKPSQWFLRCVQTYDFEADHPVSKAAWDWVGFLPVLPGPCGLYRYKDLKLRCDKYFQIVKTPVSDCGLWLSNLQIAEDRIPSTLAVFPMDALAGQHSEGEAFKTRWVRDAIFYFESEETLEKLTLQRRRWLNGTMAGYIFLAQNLRSIIWASDHSCITKLLTSVMILMQIVQTFVLALGPGIFASILFGTTHFITVHFLNPDLEALQDHEVRSAMTHTHVQIPAAATAVYLLCYLIFLCAHRYRHSHDDDTRKKINQNSEYRGWAWAMVTVLNLSITALFVYSIVLSENALADTGHNAWDEVFGNRATLDAAGSLDLTARCVLPGMHWDSATATCGTDHELDQCKHDSDCAVGSCLASVCPDLATPYSRCGTSWKHADESCGLTCAVDSDCDLAGDEKCWGNLRPPTGCATRFMGSILMIAYVFVPIFFALLDSPITGDLRAVELMLSSGIPYILFMPTFVAFFSAYSLNRLGDLSWGNRPQGSQRKESQLTAEEERKKKAQERSMQRLASCIAFVTPFMNVSFTLIMCGLRLFRPGSVRIVAWWIMGVAGYTFVIALFASLSKLLAKLMAIFGCCGSNESEDMIGGARMSIRGNSSNMFAGEVAAAMAHSVRQSVRQSLWSDQRAAQTGGQRQNQLNMGLLASGRAYGEV